MPWYTDPLNGRRRRVTQTELAQLQQREEILRQQAAAVLRNQVFPQVTTATPTFAPTLTTNTLTWTEFQQPIAVRKQQSAKQKVPSLIEDSDFLNTNFLNSVPLNATFFKNLLDAIKQGHSHVKILIKKLSPHLPQTRDYGPVFEEGLEKYDYSKPFEIWDSFDTWTNKYRKIKQEEVPSDFRKVWEIYRQQRLAIQKEPFEIKLLHMSCVLALISTKLTNEWRFKQDQITRHYIGHVDRNPEHFVNLAEKEGVTNTSRALIRQIYETYYRNVPHNLDGSPKQWMRFLPKALRSTKRKWSLTDKILLITLLHKLWRIKYKEDFPHNQFFWNGNTNHLDWEPKQLHTLVLRKTGWRNETFRDLTVIPDRYVKSGLAQNCFCCGELTMLSGGYGVWLNSQFVEFIRRKSPTEYRIRKDLRIARKLEELAKQPPKPKASPSEKSSNEDTYYDLRSLKEGTLPWKIGSALNAQIKNVRNKDYLKASAGKDAERRTVLDDITPGLDLNHTELDAVEVPFPQGWEPAWQGWWQDSARKNYVLVCLICESTVFKKPDVQTPRNRLEGIVIQTDFATPQPQLENGERATIVEIGRNPTTGTALAVQTTIKRNYFDIMYRHGTSPIDIVSPSFCLGIGENKRMFYIPSSFSTVPTKDNAAKINAKDTTLYMGVELEVSPVDAIYKNHLIDRCGINPKLFGTLYSEAKWVALRVIDEWCKHNNAAIMTHDGTTGNGFEIVTVPGTHKWHTETAWKGFFKEDYPDEEEAKFAPSAWINGWVNNGGVTKNPYLIGVGVQNRPICGIHIHVSRNAITPLQLGKMKFFVNTQTKFINAIAGRTETQYSAARLAKMKDGLLFHFNRTAGGNRLNLNQDPRYSALNLNTGKPTFEFRIFRSNVSKAGFMKNLDFVHALITWCSASGGSPANEKQLTDANFIEWIDENRANYKWLTMWLVKNKYIQSIHKFNPKYSKEYLFDDEEAHKKSNLLDVA